MGAYGEWLDVLLLLYAEDHLLEIVRRDMSFTASTPAAHGILSVDLRV